MQPTFNGINGNELVEITVARLRRMFANAGGFDIAHVYPCFSMKLNLTLEVYPRDNPNIELEMELQEKISGFKPGKNETASRYQLVDSLDGVGAKVKSKNEKGEPLPILEIEPGTPPDDVRAEHGLPVLKPTMVQGVGYVEK